MNKDKSILMEYIDACELIKETEEDIQKLRKQETVYDKVKGSNPEFPYQPQSFNISGILGIVADSEELQKEKELLQQRKANAKQIKIKVEEMMNRAPMRVQRIIRYKFFERLTWEQVAAKMGRKCTTESIKKEYQRFFEKK